MPTTVNLPGNGIQLGFQLVKSVRFSAFASVGDQSVEVSPAQAGYFVGHFFSGSNGSGTDFGQMSLDFDQAAFTALGVTTLAAALAAVFPPGSP
jgi:hypothetical protein